MPEDEEGSLIQEKAMLEPVSECDSYREVQTILDTYRETAFSDQVYEIRYSAINCPSKDQLFTYCYIKMKGPSSVPSQTHCSSYHEEHTRHFVEWDLQQIRTLTRSIQSFCNAWMSFTRITTVSGGTGVRCFIISNIVTVS